MDKSVPIPDGSATPKKGVAIETNAPAEAIPAALEAEQKKPKRTLGLKLFDAGLYPLLTNVGVFVISVIATYLTSRGGDKDAAGKLIYGKTGEFFAKRGNWIVGKFKKTGMSDAQADMSKMVLFSFVDGSLMAPGVKLLEDKREPIACWVDEKLGTVPEDKSVYKAEPKQTWLSVLGGRFTTCAIVVSTAVAMDKTGLNHKWFIKPGIQLGEIVQKKPDIAKWFGKLDVPELFKTSIFEAFYTSVCTAGLYFNSRSIARKIDKKPGDKANTQDTVTVTAEPAATTPPAPKYASERLKQSPCTQKKQASCFTQRQDIINAGQSVSLGV